MPRFSLCRLYYIVPRIVLFASFFGLPALQDFGWIYLNLDIRLIR